MQIYERRKKLQSKGRWYAPKCVTPCVTARGHSISIRLIQHHKPASTFIHYLACSSTFIHSHPHSSTFIRFHPFLSIPINCHPLSSIPINYSPFSSMFIHFHLRSSIFIHFHLRSSIFIHFHPSYPLTSIFIHFRQFLTFSSISRRILSHFNESLITHQASLITHHSASIRINQYRSASINHNIIANKKVKSVYIGIKAQNMKCSQGSIIGHYGYKSSFAKQKRSHHSCGARQPMGDSQSDNPLQGPPEISVSHLEAPFPVPVPFLVDIQFHLHL